MQPVDPRQQFLMSTLPGLLGDAWNYVRGNPGQAAVEATRALTPGGGLQDALAGGGEVSRGLLAGDASQVAGGVSEMGLGLLGAIPVAGGMVRAARGAARAGAEAAPPAAPAVRGVGARSGDLFDYSRLHEVPDVPQVAMPRYEPPRGVPARVADLTSNPQVQQQMLDVIDRGIQMGGPQWYNVEPLRRAFVDEFGAAEGARRFSQYVDIVAATSPRSPIGSNVRSASYYYGLASRGDPIPDTPPSPYGGLAQKLHVQNVRGLLDRGEWDVMQNPKPASYSQNIQGNQAPGTMDTHAVRLPALLSQDPRFLETGVRVENAAGGYDNISPRRMVQSGEVSLEDALKRPGFWYSVPAPNEYAAMENFYRDLGQRRGLTTAQTQASAWVGGGETTGLASEPLPLLRIIENRIKATADQRGLAPTDVLRRMIRGEEPLLSIGGLTAAGTLGALQYLEQEGFTE